MEKRMLRVLSLILVLCMFLSVGTPAFAVGADEADEGNENGMGQIRGFDGAQVPTMQLYAEDEDLSYAVTVEAPLGALPAGTELRVEPKEIDDVREALKEAVEEPEILLALDISFWLNEEKIEPTEPVQVILSALELEGKENVTVVQVLEDEEPVFIELIPEEELTFALEDGEFVFQTEKSAVFAVLNEIEQPEQPEEPEEPE